MEGRSRRKQNQRKGPNLRTNPSHRCDPDEFLGIAASEPRRYKTLMSTLNRRVTIAIEGDFVVFLIGARINRWWNLYKYGV